MSGRIRIGSLVLGSVGTNTYFIHVEEEEGDGSVPALIIDPADRGEELYDALEEKGLIIERILLTHGHFDHIGGVSGIRKKAAEKDRSVTVACLDREADICRDPDLNCSLSMGNRSITVEPDILLRDGEEFSACGISFRVIATPGHTEGGCCFYVQEEGVLFAGDTLFAGSVGRTDLPTGSMSVLLDSIKTKLLVLPDDTVVLPGHGEDTTIGSEKRYNLFL